MRAQVGPTNETRDTARVRVSTDMPKPGSLRTQHVCVLSDDVSQCSRVSDSSTDT